MTADGKRSSCHDFNRDVPLSRPVKFGEENPLPGTEQNLPVFDNEEQGGSDKRGLNMRRGVSLLVAMLRMRRSGLPVQG